MQAMACSSARGSAKPISSIAMRHQAPDQVKTIFTRLHHARQPVKGRIGIAGTHGFVQRGNQIECSSPDLS